MRILRFVCFVGLLLGIMNLVALIEWAHPEEVAKGPVITNAYAINKGRYGSIWRIYI